jgi:predicted RNA-binding Zn-ribbon protein involved in translation (DUF1610 family)
MATRKQADQEPAVDEVDPGDAEIGQVEFEEPPPKENSSSTEVCANDGLPAVVRTSDSRASTVYYCSKCGTASKQAIEEIDGSGG